LERGDRLLHIAELVMLAAKARDLECLERFAVFLQLRPVPGDAAVAIGHANSPDSRSNITRRGRAIVPGMSPAAAQSVIARAGGRSSIPETAVIEPIGRGILDTPHAWGMMTAEYAARSRPSQLPRIGERKRAHPPRVLVQDQRARDRRLGALAA